MVFAGDYEVVRPLAQGGMGAVYVARQRSTAKLRALKVLHPQFAVDGPSRERFVQEARVSAEIDSDHVTEVVGAGVDPATNTPWIAMELLEGEELAAQVERTGALSQEAVRELVDQLCDALAKAHAKGIVHRDLKPENLFVAKSRRKGVPFTVKVLDFGIAKAVADNATAAKVSRTIGSPLWMAPEQAQLGARLTPATDVWALGLIVFYLLTSKYYWRAPNAGSGELMMVLNEVMLMPLEAASVRAAEYGVGAALPAGFDGWFARCVDRDAARRWPHAGAAWDGLAPLLGHATTGLAATAVQGTQPVSMAPAAPVGVQAATQAWHSTVSAPVAVPAPAPPMRQRPVWLVPAALAGVATAALAGAALLLASPTRPTSASAPTMVLEGSTRAETVGPNQVPVAPVQAAPTVQAPSPQASAVETRAAETPVVTPREEPRAQPTRAAPRSAAAIRPRRSGGASSGGSSVEDLLSNAIGGRGTPARPAPVAARSAQLPTQRAEATGMEAAQACDGTSGSEGERNACVVRALRNASGEREMALLATTYRAMGNRPQALRTMRSYIQRYPNGSRSQNFQRYVEANSE